jgi:hypothetical protein
MAKKFKRTAENEPCARCGYTRKSHALANYTDGAFVGQAVLVCPFAQWKDSYLSDAPTQADDAVDPHADSTGKPSTRV